MVPIFSGRAGESEPDANINPASRDRSGQALAEFALLLPVLLLLTLLAVDFGRVFFTYVAVNNAAREATYYAAVHAVDVDDDFDQTAYAAAVADAGAREANVQGQGGEGALIVSAPVCSTSSGTVLACDAASDFDTGIRNRVAVSVSQEFSLLTPFISDVLGPVVLTASATGPVFNPPNATVVDDPDPPAPPPACAQAGFEYEVANPADEPLAVAFTDTSTGVPAAWAWDFGDGVQSDERSPAHEYQTDGNYTVSLTVDECDTDSVLVTVGDATPPDPDPDTCVVPNFVDQWWDNVGGIPALDVWESSGFDRKNLVNNAQTNQIATQTLEASTTVECDSRMNVRK